MSFIPKVSVVLPSLNVANYIEECIQSAINQTLHDIEIICVDAGSTDGTLELLEHYSNVDNRVKVLHSDVKSYGKQMNIGMDFASGEYLAILETDDYIKPNMYEVLYKEAKKLNLDVIKSDYEIFVGDSSNRTFTYMNTCRKKSDYYNVINPRENISIFNARINTWTGLYNMNFLRKNNIRHNETLGASYQDNGFWFQTFLYANRIYFIDRAFYMLRRDNPNSSVHNKGKVYSIFDEYSFIENKIRKDEDKENSFIKIFQKKKYDNCRFHYDRIGDEFKMDYLRRMSDEFKEARSKNELDETLFIGNGFRDLCEIMDSPSTFNLRNSMNKVQNVNLSLEQENILLREKVKFYEKEIRDIKQSFSFKIGRLITFFPRKIRGGIWCYKEHGFRYTINRLLIHLHILKEKK